ncbi:MAG: NUDIX hydrolase N-terminal domain-containing protein, partial [Anaerolineales bacterium]|nr:NUDIX hydrolase N-terminal domain-containing protein [Anaerolineales bacterium]
MSAATPPRWLEWAREIQALAQTGYHCAENDYQRQRFQRLSEIAAEIISAQSDMDCARLKGVFLAQIG